MPAADSLNFGITMTTLNHHITPQNVDSKPFTSKDGIENLKLNVSKYTADINTVINSEQNIDTSSTIASLTAARAAQAETLLIALWRSNNSEHQNGCLNSATKQFKNTPVKNITDAISTAFAYSDDGLESYFAMAEYSTPESRTAANVSGTYGFWMDIDIGDTKASAGKGYRTIEDAQAALEKFRKDNKIPLPTHIVNSGSGLHVYWAVSEFIDRETWQKFAKMLKALTKHVGFLADDTRTADIASVLRVPGTFNHKYNPPRLVTLQHASDNYIDRDAMLAAIESAHEHLCVTETVASKPNDTHIGSAGTATDDMHETLHNVEKVKSALAAINPDCEREVWFKTCCALRSLNWNCGESLARAWSKGDFWTATNQTATKYDTQAFDIMWKSIKSDAGISIGTLFHYAKNAGWTPADHSQVDGFKICETVVIESNGQTANQADAASDSQTETKQQSSLQIKANPLDKFSLLGRSADLEKLATKQDYILGNLAIAGQATVLYASSNTGKTLLVLYLLIEAIKLGKIAPSKLYYINVDDDLSGVIQKNTYAEEYGFNMLAEGYQNFTASAFLELMTNLTVNNQANGVIIVLDTLKKFANLMDKVNSSKLTMIVRGFIMKGGSVIALAHANKKLDSDGKPIFTGTTDILDDFDCAYRMYPIDGEPDLKTIEFENIKRRGDVPSVVAYSYNNESGISYTERFMSVQKVDESQLNSYKLAAKVKSDAEVIGFVSACITEGISTKTKLAFAVAERAGIGRGTVIKLIDKYTGTDATIHKWAYSVGDRGTKSFTVLTSVTSTSVSNAS